jgi:5-histidylcysteine sulfoxide synthase/putative 4-mercaptohistidine N1-methyltranferase
MDPQRKRTVTLSGHDAAAKRKELKKYFLDVIAQEDSLFSLLKNDESFYQRPDRLRHPLVFYYGHPFTFYVNKLFVGHVIPERVNADYESMFAIGVDEMSWDDLNENHYDWPSIEKVKEYRDQVQSMVVDLIDTAPISLPIEWNSSFWVLMMGIEHHRIHLETSSVLIRQLDLSYIEPKSEWAPCSLTGEAPSNKLLPVKGGELKLGKTHDQHDLYGWDNEYGEHTAVLKDFSASKFLVSNQEFKGFVDAGGYDQQKYWSDEGWKWKSFTGATSPLFWTNHNQQKLRVLDREIPMPWDWPVEINYLEANAFCQWKSIEQGITVRLPTEDEWSQLRAQQNIGDLPDWDSGEKKIPANLDLSYRSPVPVNHFSFVSQDEFYDVIGNVWQWTETPIYPYQGFKVHPTYDDFTVPTFDHQHHLMKGGSFISTGNEATASARYAFRKHFYQHAGFRYVQSENTMTIEDNIYETDISVSQYCEFHFGDQYFGVPNFPKACIREVENHLARLPQRKTALDLGCAVGRSTLELAKHFDHVTGLDFSARFIEKAQLITDQGNLRYAIPTEGELLELHERTLAEMELESCRGKVNFFQADACNMPKKYGNYDLIFAGNLIDRLYSPKVFLEKISEYLNPQGILVITSPYTWLEEFTPKKEWLGGFKKDGENVSTLDGLTENLSYAFDRVADPVQVPFVIRETAHKFQHTLSEMTVWQKR